MMGRIQTVLGCIEPEQLGITMMHEHLLWNQDIYQKPVDPETPDGKLAFSRIVPENMLKIRQYHLHDHRQCAKQTDAAEAAKEAMHLRTAGGGALVDCTCLGLDRDPLVEKYVAEQTGLHIIMSTGVYSKGSCPEVETMSREEKTALFIRELTEGVGDTGIKAGVIGEIGISCFDEHEEGSLAAAGRAQAETGAAVLIHQPGLWKIGQEILDVLEENGADSEKVVLCHCDPVSDDTHYLEKLMDRGANLSFDQFGLEAWLRFGGPQDRGIWLPRDIDRVRAIARLCELGYSRQIVMSQDLCFQICYRKYGGGGYAHILEDIVPIMRAEGITKRSEHRILVENPARILAK